MKRRAFLSASCALSIAPIIGMPVAGASLTAPGVQYFEWIRYQLPHGNKRDLVAGYYRDIAVPALNKHGIKNVGIFNVKHGPDMPTLHVMIPHPSFESAITLNDKLLEDKVFVQQGNRFLNGPLSDMPFIRMEKSLLKAFSNLPEIQIPKQKTANRTRIFQVRVYEAPGLVASKKKIHMFNEGGEIEIFKRTGLQPVLFGETIFGDHMPNLVYMLAFDDMEDLTRSWNTFRNDPEWETLKNEPYYADTVSSINDWIWTPTGFSQI